MLKMAARNFLQRCTEFFNRISIESLRIRDSSVMHLGKILLAAIFCVIVDSQVRSENFYVNLRKACFVWIIVCPPQPAKYDILHCRWCIFCMA